MPARPSASSTERFPHARAATRPRGLFRARRRFTGGAPGAPLRWAAAALTAACALAFGTARASALPATAEGEPARGLSMQFCGNTAPQTARQQDRVLQFASVIRKTLQASGEDVALIGRSGLDLSRFQLNYSHGGVLLRSDGEGDIPWTVRQLYYDCDQGRPRLFDQGLAGFLMSAEAPDLAYVSIVLLPADDARRLREAALDMPRVSRLLAATYSANAYPFSTRYQNCNQWVAELLATAWAPLPDGPALRSEAQTWLRQAGYNPKPIAIDSHLTKLVGSLLPLVHLDDHPEDVQLGMAFQFSLPGDIEAFVRRHAPSARRIEFCHDTDQVVVREGWEPIGTRCTPDARLGDRVLPF